MSTPSLAAWSPGRISTLRGAMESAGVSALVVRGTDRFLNEYVPTAESARVWATGFSGSTGDALVLRDSATVFVDGRYTLQAAGELDASHWRVHTAPQGTSIERALADALVAHARSLPGGRSLRVGYEPDRFSLELYDRFASWLADARIELVPCTPSLVERARGECIESRGTVRAVDERAVGRTVREKVDAVGTWLGERGASAMVVQRLDDIAYLTNLRGDELPYQATFRSVALVTPREVVLAVDPAKVPASVRGARDSISFVPDDAFTNAVRALGEGATIALDPGGTTRAMRALVEGAGAKVLLAASPLTAMKARKTPAELDAMQRAFAKADRVVLAAQRWLIDRVLSGARVSETDFAAQVERMFREAGAVGLSFKVISACGENAAVAHHPPDATRYIGRGEMMLLDTGAYFDEGYATDLTRTFFVGDASDTPTDAMRRYFTLTLRAAIAGMTARIPKGANGAQLDGITRAPLWDAGLEFNHGTGHGVGINVHEFPPRVASVSTAPIEPGHVFSIEPGVYVANEAGVRIENLCTVVEDTAHPGFLQVKPMTFSPLDARLIDLALLTPREKDFLVEFAAGFEPRG